jgi:hypothetical protein
MDMQHFDHLDSSRNMHHLAHSENPLFVEHLTELEGDAHGAHVQHHVSHYTEIRDGCSHVSFYIGIRDEKNLQTRLIPRGENKKIGQ